MKSKLQKQNFSLKFLTPLFLIVCYWFYLNICFGYFLSKIFYDFFDSTNKTSFYKIIKFRKKFSFKNIIKIIIDFYQLQKLDPIVRVFSNMAFRSYVCFPYVKCNNPSGKSWMVEVLVAEELFCFPYPFQLPKSFLNSANKHDLRLKVRLMKSLAVSEREKRLDLQEFFNKVSISIPNNHLIQIKKNIIRLLNELVGNNIIQNKIEIELKSGKNKDHLIQNLTTSDITRRIKYIKFHEKIKIL